MPLILAAARPAGHPSFGGTSSAEPGGRCRAARLGVLGAALEVEADGGSHESLGSIAPREARPQRTILFAESGELRAVLIAFRVRLGECVREVREPLAGTRHKECQAVSDSPRARINPSALASPQNARSREQSLGRNEASYG